MEFEAKRIRQISPGKEQLGSGKSTLISREIKGINLSPGSRDFRAASPEIKGYFRASLLYMRVFAEAWLDPAIALQTFGQLP